MSKDMVDDALRRCLHAHVNQTPVTGDWLGTVTPEFLHETLAVARASGVLLPVYDVISRTVDLSECLSPKTSVSIQRFVEDRIQKAHRNSVEGAELLRCLQSQGVDCLLLKGDGFTAQCGSNRAARERRDVDILVRRCDVDLTKRIAASAGYMATDDHDERRVLTCHAAPLLKWAGGEHFWAEVHWNIDPRWRAFRIDIGEMFASSREIPVGLLTCRALSPVHSLIHACLHFSFWGRRQLKKLVDVATMAVALPATGGAEAWREFESNASCWRVPHVMYLGLSAATRHLSVVLPEALLRRLRASCSRAQAMWSDELSFGGIVRPWSQGDPDAWVRQLWVNSTCLKALAVADHVRRERSIRKPFSVLAAHLRSPH